MDKIKRVQRNGFSLIEVLLALSLTSIIVLSFTSIIFNCTKLYKKEMVNTEQIQKSILLNSWLTEKINCSGHAFISEEGEKLSWLDEDNIYLYKLITYNSQGEPAVGINKYSLKNNVLKYIYKEPIMNGVVDIKVEEVPIGKNQNYLFRIFLQFQNSTKDFVSMIY